MDFLTQCSPWEEGGFKEHWLPLVSVTDNCMALLSADSLLGATPGTEEPQACPQTAARPQELSESLASEIAAIPPLTT